MPSQPGDRDRRVGDLLGQAPGAEGAANRKAALFMARAEAARAAWQARYKSPLRRLIGRALRSAAQSATLLPGWGVEPPYPARS
jgi:hypothetical protein